MPQGNTPVCAPDAVVSGVVGKVVSGLFRRGVVPYPVMSVEEIMAIPVPEIMHQDSVLWMWARNRHLAAG